MQNENETSIFVKVQSKHRQVISGKVSKSFRGADDLVVFNECFCDFSGFLDFQKITKRHQVTITLETLRKLAWNHLTVFWLVF